MKNTPLSNPLFSLHSLSLVHGWGEMPDLWREMIKLTQQSYIANSVPIPQISCVDMGFFHGDVLAADKQPDLLITHSLGALYAMQHGARPRCGFVIVNGFHDFSDFAPDGTVALMRRGLKRNAAAQMQDFWKRAGLMRTPDCDGLNAGRLDEGLGWLMDWGTKEAFDRLRLTCPILILAGQADQICPIESMVTHWEGYDMKIHPDAGHSLPQSHPEWCLEQITDWLGAR